VPTRSSSSTSSQIDADLQPQETPGEICARPSAASFPTVILSNPGPLYTDESGNANRWPVCDRYRYRNRYRYRRTSFQSGHSIAIPIAIPIASLQDRPSLHRNTPYVIGSSSGPVGPTKLEASPAREVTSVSDDRGRALRAGRKMGSFPTRRRLRHQMVSRSSIRKKPARTTVPF